MPNINLIYYLIAGGIFGALALKTGIPKILKHNAIVDFPLPIFPVNPILFIYFLIKKYSTFSGFNLTFSIKSA